VKAAKGREGIEAEVMWRVALGLIRNLSHPCRDPNDIRLYQ
jgi:hypothetical protein